MIRNYSESDLDQIRSIHNKHHAFSFPEIANAYARIVISDGDKVLGYGQVKDLTEAEMVVDLSLPKLVRGEVLSGLIREAIFAARKHRAEEHIHAFITDPSFERVLEKRYGFKECRGKALVMRI